MIFLEVQFRVNLFLPYQKGFENSMGTGVLAAYPVENMKVRVFDGSFPCGGF